MVSSTTFVNHLFMPGHTIEAIIKKENRHDVTPEELQMLLAKFAELNGNEVPKGGSSAKIPVLEKYV